MSTNRTDHDVRIFRLAPMSPFIRILTGGLLALPMVFLAGTTVESWLALPAALLIAIYLWIWLRFRPTRFVADHAELHVEWPLKRRTLRRSDISAVRLIDARELAAETGWCVRVGAGGLWGGFGWLWTQQRGMVQMYVSRTDRFVWIECAHARSWLITPEQPEVFVTALAPQRPSENA